MVRMQQLTVLSLFINVSLAVWQHKTVMEGGTLTLTCPIRNAHKSHVEWKNPKGFVMFFNHNKALKDKRYSIEKLSASEFTISVSNITFKDGGNYTCIHYSNPVREKTVEVTVLGYPKIAVTRLNGKHLIKCTAAGNHHIPQIYWLLDNKIEIAAQTHPSVEYGIRKYTSEDILHIKPVGKRVTVTCIVRHPALHGKVLSNFVNIGQASRRFPWLTATTSPMTQPQRSTDMPRIPPQWPKAEGTTETPQNTDTSGPSSEGSLNLSTVSSSGPATITYTTGIHLSTIYDSESSLSDSTFTKNNDTTVTNVTTITDRTHVAEVTNATSQNGTSRNITIDNFEDELKGRQKVNGSSVLVFLVTCLIFSLLVVVIFFVIKLRRAHILWKKENEESDQSIDSSKSKSSHEEKQVQGQKRRGLFNGGLTTYVIHSLQRGAGPSQEPTEITEAPNTSEESAAESIQKDTHITPQTDVSVIEHIKETEL